MDTSKKVKERSLNGIGTHGRIRIDNRLSTRASEDHKKTWVLRMKNSKKKKERKNGRICRSLQTKESMKTIEN